jgi:integrase
LKFEILDNFKTFLEGKYASRATAKQYRSWAARLSEVQAFSSCAEIDFESMAKGLESITKNRNEYSQAKNALLNFAEFSQAQAEIPALQVPKKRRYRKLKPKKLGEINRKINVIPDKRLLLCYKIMLATGLRMGELANIKQQSIKPLENGGFSLEFVSKGGKADKIEIPAEQKYICKGIADILQRDKTFYSVNYLHKNARKRGFACHDLRRAFAKTTHKSNSRNIEETCEKMRHASPRTTKIYLKSKVEV